MSTITRTGLREVICDEIRGHRGEAPYDLTDKIMAVLKRHAPKAFIENHIDVDTAGDARFEAIAREMILSHAFDVAQYEVHAAYPKLSDMEVQLVDDMIGQAQVVVSF